MRLFSKMLLYGCMQLFVICNAQAHEVVTGIGVSCDTQEQVEMFAHLGGKPQAIALVNEQAHGNVCAIVEVAYIRGKTVAQVRNEHTYDVAEILVVGFKKQGGWQQLPPVLQYTLFAVTEEPA